MRFVPLAEKFLPEVLRCVSIPKIYRPPVKQRPIFLFFSFYKPLPLDYANLFYLMVTVYGNKYLFIICICKGTL